MLATKSRNHSIQATRQDAPQDAPYDEEDEVQHSLWVWDENPNSAEREKELLLAQLNTFETISLAEMNNVALLDRVEVKYLFHINDLAQLLAQMQAHYAVLMVEGQRLNRYQTLYFDTSDFSLYYRHHMGARNRYKIRAREYVETGYTFLEVKHKTNKKRTVKSRIATPALVNVLEGGAAQFLTDKCPYSISELSPRLWNRYSRITLVNRQDQERVTLDIDLSFAWGEQQMGVPALVIAEVKQPARMCLSPFMVLMRQHGIRKASFSKYCVGVSLLYPEVKHNKFKATHRLVAKLMQGEIRQGENKQGETMLSSFSQGQMMNQGVLYVH